MLRFSQFIFLLSLLALGSCSSDSNSDTPVSESYTCAITEPVESGTSWTETFIDSGNLSSGGNMTFAMEALSDNSVVAAGFSSFGTWSFRSSRDRGENWSETLHSVDTSLYDAFLPRDILEMGSGTLIAVGNGETLSSADPRGEFLLVFRSTDGGVNWEYFFPNSDVRQNYRLGDVKEDSSGNLYTVTHFLSSDWEVYKSTDSGANWTLVEKRAQAGSDYFISYGVAVSSIDDVYVIGRHYSTSTEQSTIEVRKSTDGGTSWSTVDSFQITGSDTSYPVGIVVDGSDNLYYAAYNQVTSSNRRVVIRRSSDAGSSWTSPSEYEFPSERFMTEATSMDVTTGGEVYVSGESTSIASSSNNATSRWWVLKSEANGASIALDNDFTHQDNCSLNTSASVSGGNSWPLQTLVTNSGDVYVGGQTFSNQLIQLSGSVLIPPQSMIRRR